MNKRGWLLGLVVLVAWAFGTYSFFARVRSVEEKKDQFSDMGQYVALRAELEGYASAGFVSRLSNRPKNMRQFFTAQYQVFPTTLTYTGSRDRNFKKMARRLLKEEVWVCVCDKPAFESHLLKEARAQARRRGFELEIERLAGAGLLVARRRPG
ncbi:MAG: hypothetical protein GY719_31850 [bacterium]|nr:hypothetical protein [bacterium]